MQAVNAKRVAALDAAVEDARQNRGDSEVREALLAKCTHYARIGDLENCLASIEVCAKQTLAVGPRLDLIFQRIRLGFAFSDNDVAADGIRDAHRLINSSDWERRNRLKVYEGIYYIFIRDFAKSSALLLDSVTTFASGELISFKDFIFVTLIATLPVLSRADLKKRIIDSPEVISAGVADAYGLVSAIYTCDYGSTFTALDAVCQHQRRLIYVSSHVNYFFRGVRVLVFTQFLDSYSSVTLQRMATTFRIPVKVLDQMLGTIISNERITCRVDRVSDSIYTYRGDSMNFDYHRIIKNGDLLLNRIQKLSRLVDM
ncbi:26S proteasome regulatory subunit N7 [Strigomonas culicis]|nr:26S proteasome regulatory subunit N7 [Strigomonas culicis]|eukprot:EPY35799.1 26S proteasome regulatory subunit N7 [Strigomonas culicis]